VETPQSALEDLRDRVLTLESQIAALGRAVTVLLATNPDATDHVAEAQRQARDTLRQVFGDEAAEDYKVNILRFDVPGR
jgi:hypothetical protein